MSDGETSANHAFAATLVDELVRRGLRHACVSPGSRSAPLAIAFARHPGVRLHMHVDERSGSFFAVGLAKEGGDPLVALVCTSGTAAAEFHAAVVEAFHSQTPLLVLTADRPPELIGVGANQAIDQTRLYGSAVRWFHDPGPPALGPEAGQAWRALAGRAVAEALGPPAGPVHLNLPFREPLVPPVGADIRPLDPPAGGGGVYSSRRREPRADLAEALRPGRRPLVFAGAHPLPLPTGRVAARLPVLAEPISQGRRPGTITAYEALLRAPGWAAAHRPSAVIRLGAAPTSRTVSEWLAGLDVPVFLVDPHGLRRDPDGIVTACLGQPEPDVLEVLGTLEVEPGWVDAWREADGRAAAAIDSAFADTLHEGSAVRALARALPEPANVFLGSSLPVRDADWFWPAAPRVRFFGNRGASGIDGLVSTGLGIARASADPTVLLLGDLSLYHDMNGLWAVRRHGVRATVVVLDNGGGGIFEFLPPAQHRDLFEEVFATPLGLDLQRVAALYGLEHRLVETVDGLQPALARALSGRDPQLVQVRFTRAASVAGHRAAWDAVAAALARA